MMQLNSFLEFFKKCKPVNLCDLCGQPYKDCKSRTITKGTVVRSKDNGSSGTAEDKGDHIEVTFNSGTTQKSLHYAKCVFFKDYVILQKA